MAKHRKQQKYQKRLAVLVLLFSLSLLLVRSMDIQTVMSFVVDRYGVESSGAFQQYIQHYRTAYSNNTAWERTDEQTADTRNYIPEDELLFENPILDSLLAANATMSSMTLQGLSNGSATFRIGQEVRIGIRLHDGYGNPKRVGGDHLRVRLHEQEQGAFSAGYVVDHHNGSYTAVVTPMWVGNPVVSVALFYSREAVRALYGVRRQLPGTRNIIGLFSTAEAEESSVCHPFHSRVSDAYRNVCNLTLQNSGLSWFCGQPSNRNLLCHDWTLVKVETPFPDLPLTRAERLLLSDAGIGVYIPQHTRLHVIPAADRPYETIVQSSVSCAQVSRGDLWRQKSPTGFFYHNRWYTRRCKMNRNIMDWKKCLECAKVYLLGDSTVRSWYSMMTEVLNCTPSTEIWTTEKWHKPASCVNRDYNFHVSWFPHAQPFAVGVEWDTKRYTTTSIAAYIEQISHMPDNSKVIVLIHIFMHLVSYSTDVFEDRIRGIRGSVERLLARKPNAVVAIKGPHTFRESPAGGAERLSDYFGFQYRDIMAREFAPIQDRVVFLQQYDFTISHDSKTNHPVKPMTMEMVAQMMGFICV